MIESDLPALDEKFLNIARASDTAPEALAASGLSVREILSVCARLTKDEREMVASIRGDLARMLFHENVRSAEEGASRGELERRAEVQCQGDAELRAIVLDDLEDLFSANEAKFLVGLEAENVVVSVVESIDAEMLGTGPRSVGRFEAANAPPLADQLIAERIVTRAEWEKACAKLGEGADSEHVVAQLGTMSREIGLRQEPILTKFQLDRIRSGAVTELRIGNRILLDLLSGEGNAQVYRAWHPDLDRLEVVKRLRFESPRSRASFTLEARLLSELAFIGQLPRVYEAAVGEGGMPFIAMEFIDGHDLRWVVETQKRNKVPIPFQRAVQWACELCEILHAAHTHGRPVIHRDVKPENIMLANVGSIKLLDLGIASLRSRLDPDTQGASTSSSRIGTPRYMPPEQWTGGSHVDGRADIYSLGCCLYYFLTGEDLFQEKDVAALEAAHRRGCRPVIDRRDVPPGFVEALSKMITPDPDGRYLTAEEAGAALRSFIEPRVRPMPSPVPSPNALVARVATAVLGDRAEDPPHTSADILARSVSTGDLTYFGDLGLRARIRSHKVVKIADLEGQRRVLGDDFLVIGSPAVNLVARTVNSLACFRFAITDEAQALVTRFESELEPIKFNRAALQNFLEPRTTEDAERIRDLHIMHNQLAKGGYIDPIHYKGLRGERRAHNDFGVVTLCLNPLDETKIVILAAGTSGPGTAAALKLLAQPDQFAQRPLGGVFRVEISMEAAWPDRYDWLDPKWDTHPYDVLEYESSVAALVEQVERKEVPHWEGFTRGDAEKLRKLLALLKARGAEMDLLVQSARERLHESTFVSKRGEDPHVGRPAFR